MARYASIRNGAVDNLIEATAEVAQERGLVLAPVGCQIGWLYAGGVFTAAVRPKPVPAVVTRYQFITAIRNAGKADELRTYIQSLSNGELEEWQHRSRVFRHSSMMEAARTALGVTNNAVDNLFRAAAEIED